MKCECIFKDVCVQIPTYIHAYVHTYLRVYIGPVRAVVLLGAVVAGTGVQGLLATGRGCRG